MQYVVGTLYSAPTLSLNTRPPSHRQVLAQQGGQHQAVHQILTRQGHTRDNVVGEQLQGGGRPRGRGRGGSAGHAGPGRSLLARRRHEARHRAPPAAASLRAGGSLRPICAPVPAPAVAYSNEGGSAGHSASPPPAGLTSSSSCWSSRSCSKLMGTGMAASSARSAAFLNANTVAFSSGSAGGWLGAGRLSGLAIGEGGGRAGWWLAGGRGRLGGA